MERILIVDDNKALSKLIAKKMQSSTELGLEIDVAHDFAEAQALIQKHKNNYFIALLDLNLPDAPNGEIVDYALENNLCVIVLTGSIDEDTKSNFVKKNIIDYVYKGNVDDVNFIFKMIERLYKNKQYKAMIVEDSTPVRNELKRMLKNLQFEVFAAAHGEEAMSYYEDHPDMKLVLTDFNMPVKNGLEVLRELREKADKNTLGIIAMTSPNDDVGAATFLKSGANDFLAKPFGREELTLRVNNTIEAMENIEKIANFANKDFLTGVYNRRFFYANMSEYIPHANSESEPYAVAMLDIDFFKKINDTYGHDVGDKVIQTLAKKLDDSVKGRDVVARFGGEEFCVVLKNIQKTDAIKFFVAVRSAMAANVVEYKDQTIKFTVSIGVAFSDNQRDIHELLEMADSALYNAKENGRNRVEIAE
ncbi:GGDEF domain-containing response regulator [Campylobacter mucosalis]|uniref:GGDEF domain-containing response regulator n=1 Tax=Campylobacter mucosalis TaxID=202 RepID=UPI0014704E7A|nr:diguanylate cyclase [Campylobacter mucosalis]